MKNFYDVMHDITTDLVSGDIIVSTKIQTSGEGKYAFIPTGIMVVKNSATDEVAPVKCQLRGGGEMVLYLKINEPYPLAVEKIYDTGSTNESIVLLGVIR